MTKLAAAIKETVADMLALRPIRSASQPNTNPPSGRAMNPTAKMARLDSSAEKGSC